MPKTMNFCEVIHERRRRPHWSKPHSRYPRGPSETGGGEAGRHDIGTTGAGRPTGKSSPRDFTGVNPDDRRPIDPRMPPSHLDLRRQRPMQRGVCPRPRVREIHPCLRVRGGLSPPAGVRGLSPPPALQLAAFTYSVRRESASWQLG